jgi:hypothetical protein
MPRSSAKKKNVAQPLTTAQRLGALIKSARQIMRKDKGLNGDLDRLPLFTWILFLKFLDDMEINAESEAGLAGKKYRPVIDPPYRWRDWAARPDVAGDSGEFYTPRRVGENESRLLLTALPQGSFGLELTKADNDQLFEEDQLSVADLGTSQLTHGAAFNTVML